MDSSKRWLVPMVLAGMALGGCEASQRTPIGTQLSGPVGLTVGCPGPSDDCTGQSRFLYVTNANNRLRHDTGSILAIDLSRVDTSRRTNFVGDVVASQRPLPNFSGPIQLAEVVPSTGGGVPAAVITNRLSEGARGRRGAADSLHFVHADPTGADLTMLDLEPDEPGLQGQVQVGGDPFGMAHDPDTGRLYVANGADGTVSVVSLTSPCERHPEDEEQEEPDSEPPPCIVDAVDEPEFSDPELIPADSDAAPPDVLMAEQGVSQGATPSEIWTVTFVEDADTACSGGRGFWRVRGEVRGPQSRQACTGEQYSTDQGGIVFTIAVDEEVDEPVLPVTGDRFVFETRRGDFDDFSPISLAASVRGANVNGRGASKLTLDSANGYLYATSRRSAYVYVLDPATGLSEALIPVSTVSGGFDARDVVVAPDGSEIYVANRNPDALVVLSPTTVGDTPGVQILEEAVVDAVGLGGRPSGMNLTADGSQLLVSCLASGEVWAVDRLTRTVSAVARVKRGPFEITLSPDGSRAFVANYDDDSISVLDADPSSPTFMRVLTTIVN